MRTLVGSMLLLAAMALLLTGVEAGDKEKKVVLKGTITCAKCDLKLEKKCATVIVTKEKGKDVVYYFAPTAAKKYHSDICQTPMPGTVEGTVMTEGKKHIITPTKVTFSK